MADRREYLIVLKTDDWELTDRLVACVMLADAWQRGWPGAAPVQAQGCQGPRTRGLGGGHLLRSKGDTHPHFLLILVPISVTKFCTQSHYPEPYGPAADEILSISGPTTGNLGGRELVLRFLSRK